MDIGIGLSTERDPVIAAKKAIYLAKTKLGKENVDLAIVFSSIEFASVNLLQTIAAYLEEDTALIGASGAAIISNQGIFKHAVAVMLLAFSEGVYFNAASVKEIKKRTPLNAGRELGEKLLYGFKDVRRVFSVIFSDGLIEGGSNFIYGLQEMLGRSFPLVGASASDNLRFLKTYVFSNQEAFDDGACGILCGGRLNFGLGIRHGWKPLGKPRTVTKCYGNVIYEIDNLAAVKIYEEYLARKAADLQKDLKRISILYPIGMYLAGEEEYLLRNVSSIGEDGSLRLHGNIIEGSLIRLMIGTKESCLEATRQASEEAKKGLESAAVGFRKEQMKNFALVFDSVSRYILLRRQAPKELEILKQTLGEETPILGLYTYGEQAPLQAISYEGQTYLHNQTIAVLTIGG